MYWCESYLHPKPISFIWSPNCIDYARLNWNWLSTCFKLFNSFMIKHQTTRIIGYIVQLVLCKELTGKVCNFAITFNVQRSSFRFSRLFYKYKRLCQKPPCRCRCSIWINNLRMCLCLTESVYRIHKCRRLPLAGWQLTERWNGKKINYWYWNWNIKSMNKRFSFPFCIEYRGLACTYIVYAGCSMICIIYGTYAKRSYLHTLYEATKHDTFLTCLHARWTIYLLWFHFGNRYFFNENIW